MLFEIDLAQLSCPCIGEIAKQATSAEALDSIAEYAMGAGFYVDEHEPYHDETYYYMDEVIMNPNLSEATLAKLIRYNKSKDMHMCLIEERTLTVEQLDAFIKSINDLSLIEFLIEKQHPHFNADQYDTIARRIMSTEICVRDCYDYFFSHEENSVDEEIHEIASHCTEQVAKNLLGWWSVAKKNLYDYEVNFTLINTKSKEQWKGFDTSDMDEKTADSIAEGIMRDIFQLADCKDSDSDDERSFDDAILAIEEKCSSEVKIRLDSLRCDFKKAEARKKLKK